MQEAYAEGIRAMSDFLRVRDPNGYVKLKERLFEVQNHIRLVGIRQTSVKFDRFVSLMSALIDAAIEEVSKFRPLAKPERRAEDAFPSEVRKEMTAAYEEFLLAARRDIGTDESVYGGVARHGSRSRRSRSQPRLT